MKIKKICIACIVSLLPLFVAAQACKITLSGYVVDQATEDPLDFTEVYLVETKAGAIADENGHFELSNLCPGAYHLVVSHIGCDVVKQFINITADTTLHIQLQHHAELLNEVVVHGRNEAGDVNNSSSIKREALTRESNKSLSEVIGRISGVSLLKTGAGISKPVIDGLYGNRIAILNNGIPQAGQQWGNDHAPEIDPFVADHLSVVKGASALAYGGSLGGVVQVDAAPPTDDPHLHGEASYIFQTNGLGNTVNVRFEQAAPFASWRASGTFKLMGDARTPDYFLTNTGRREGNFALQFDKKMNSGWRNSLYYSLFSARIGILRGSQIGNLTDLQEAIGREVPFFTNDNFSYDINPPSQLVRHHLLKWESKRAFDDHHAITLRYGGQIDDRQEFDVRRGGRSDIPAMSLLQFSNLLDGDYTWQAHKGGLLKVGSQLQYVVNTNRPETGILPLIPNYASFQSAGYAIWKQEIKSTNYELGARYDFKNLEVAAISTDLPRRVEHFKHDFHNVSLSAGVNQKWVDGFNTKLELGYVLRAPEVNELYSQGLHQGVSGIEEGNRGLSAERSFKAVAGAEWNWHEKFFLQGMAYLQHIGNYIYLQPQPEPRLTIRGAFPLFLYEQTNARLLGFDGLASWSLSQSVKVTAKYALVRGEDLSHQLPLIYMPSDNLSLDTEWFLKNTKKWKDISLSVDGRYVFKQDRLQPEQDFLPPPDAYFLLGAGAQAKLQLKKASLLRLSLRVDNVLNARYRDYLNRQRYFADELGVNVNMRVGYVF